MTPTEIFNTFILPHQSAAQNFLVSLSCDCETAQDVLQEVNLRIFKRISEGAANFEAQQQAKSFLLISCKYLYFTWRKKALRMDTFSSLTKEEDEAFPVFEDKENLQTTCENHDFLSIVIDRVKALEYSEYLLMYAHGFSYEDVSNRFNVPISTVKNRIFAQRKEIKKMKPSTLNK